MINKLMGILSGDKGQTALKLAGVVMTAMLIGIGQMQPFDVPTMPY